MRGPEVFPFGSGQRQRRSRRRSGPRAQSTVRASTPYAVNWGPRYGQRRARECDGQPRLQGVESIYCLWLVELAVKNGKKAESSPFVVDYRKRFSYLALSLETIRIRLVARPLWHEGSLYGLVSLLAPLGQNSRIKRIRVHHHSPVCRSRTNLLLVMSAIDGAPNYPGAGYWLGAADNWERLADMVAKVVTAIVLVHRLQATDDH